MECKDRPQKPAVVQTVWRPRTQGCLGEKLEMGEREEVFVRRWEKKEFGIKPEKRLGIRLA